MSARTIATIRVGDSLGPLVKKPSMVSLFRFSAATWNAHRLHYDHELSKGQGADRPLVQAYLLGAYLSELAQDWGGSSARLQKLSYRARRPVAVDDEVTCVGSVTAQDGQVVDLELRIERGGEVCVTGTAQLVIQ
jgi:hydroxyacyl-ACP dehydratase HTD2-like protein with hotdog domain